MNHPSVDLVEGMDLKLSGGERRVTRRAGTDERPIIRLEGIEDREAAEAFRGEMLLVDEAESPLEDDEYLVADLVGCEVPGLGYVERVLDAPSCALLEVGEGSLLIPLVSDAVKRVDLERKIIEVDRDFLGF